MTAGRSRRGDPPRAPARDAVPPRHHAHRSRRGSCRRCAFPRPILDIGCGDGHFGSVIFPEGADVGLDPGIADLSEAVRRGVYRLLVSARLGRDAVPDGLLRVGRLQLRVRAHPRHRCDGRRDRPRAASPEATFACTVVGEHFSEFLTDARAWRRLGLARAHRAYLDWFNRKSVHFHFDSPPVWKERFERVGLEVRRWRYYLSPRGRATRSIGATTSACRTSSARKLTGRWVPFPAADRQRVLGPAARGATPRRPNPRPAPASPSSAPRRRPILL